MTTQRWIAAKKRKKASVIWSSVPVIKMAAIGKGLWHAEVWSDGVHHLDWQARLHKHIHGAEIVVTPTPKFFDSFEEAYDWCEKQMEALK